MHFGIPVLTPQHLDSEVIRDSCTKMEHIESLISHSPADKVVLQPLIELYRKKYCVFGGMNSSDLNWCLGYGTSLQSSWSW